MKSQAVLGLGFGDCGKGKVVSYLCSQSPDSLVVRFCGGQQAGHHVMINKYREHVFANFGSGTLQGNPTYWSEYCTFDPVGFYNEWNILKQKGNCYPITYVNENCPVTTPFEKEYNRYIDSKAKHGTCGVGVGQTWEREKNHYSLKVRDLFYPSVAKIKLEMLVKHFYRHFLSHVDGLSEFIERSNEICSLIQSVKSIPEDYNNYIFEGSQGLLLDQDIGFFPHVTRSNTGLKNIFAMGFNPEVFLVTRAYQTRHGNGCMTNENVPHSIRVNPYEQNPDDNMQGKFRRTLLDIDLLKYAIEGDRRIKPQEATLVITCLDLIDKYQLTLQGRVKGFDNEFAFVDFIQDKLGVENVFVSSSPLTYDLKVNYQELIKV